MNYDGRDRERSESNDYDMVLDFMSTLANCLSARGAVIRTEERDQIWYVHEIRTNVSPDGCEVLV